MSKYYLLLGILTLSCADGKVDEVTDPNDTADGDTDSDTDVDTNAALGEWCEGQPEEFSFFVTSMLALWTLSGDDINDMNGGFGGDFGGLAGADDICQTIGTATGHGHKTWRAFLSATDDGNGNEVHAIDRIGVGPWYDANGRLVASGISGLLSDDRPDGDTQSVEDLPDECGIPISLLGDAHDVVTGTNENGQLHSNDPDTTCNDWTTSDGDVGSNGEGGQGGGGGPGGGGPGGQGGQSAGTIICGHSFPREDNGGPGGGGPGGGGPGGDGTHWMSDHPLRGCGKGANLLQNGPGEGTCIGCSGGYGAVYCFAE
jgi:hypothetical protein